MISQPDPTTPTGELGGALTALEELGRQKRPHPTRHDARALLVPLGQLLLAGADVAVDEVRERIAAATRTCTDRWTAALTEELQLACAEFVTSVDERYLDMPSYDFDYTSAARERLEARLVACEALGVPIPAGMRTRIADADRIYAPYLERGKGPGDGPDDAS